MNLNKLEKLAKLKEMGALTEEEFEDAKKEVMKKGSVIPEITDNKLGMTDSNYYVLMHVSQFFGVVIPFLGIIVPILMWLMNKEEDSNVDAHGKSIMNWMISSYIYLFICIALFFVFIGAFLIWIPILLMFIFPIIGAVKAKDGKVWKYPLSFSFFK